MREEKGAPRPCAGGNLVWELDPVVVELFSPGTRPGGNAEAMLRPPWLRAHRASDIVGDGRVSSDGWQRAAVRKRVSESGLPVRTDS